MKGEDYMKMRLVSIIVLVLVATIIMSGFIAIQHKETNINTVNIDVKPTAKDLSVSLAPVASYHLKVIRNGRIVEERVKTGDPATLQWYKLVADWLFALRYTSKSFGIEFDTAPFYIRCQYCTSWSTASSGNDPYLDVYLSSQSDVGFTTTSLSPAYKMNIEYKEVIDNATHIGVRMILSYINYGGTNITLASLGLKHWLWLFRVC